MVKMVFFDFDGVLTLDGSGTDSTCEALAAKKGIPYESIKAVFRPHLKSLVLTPGKYESILGPVNSELGSDINIDELLDAAQTTKRNLGMYATVEELRNAGIGTGIITDNAAERMSLLREPFKLDEFSPVIISANVGQGKWQGTRIFKVALQEAELEPGEAVFIDNTKENLLGAANLGIQTYWHDHHLNDITALRQRLIDFGVNL